MRNVRLILITLLALAATGCPQPKKSKSKANVIRYKGDPKTFYAGTRRTTSSPFAENRFVDKAAKFNLSMNVITNIIDDNKRTFEGAKEEQDPNRKIESLPTEFTNGFTFRQDTTDGSLWLENGYQKGFKLRFELKSGAWSLKEIKTEEKSLFPGKDFEIIHYSTSPDSSVFSILLYSIDEDEKNLTSLYFTKDRGGLSPIVDLKLPYYYLLGRGIKSAWKADQPVQIENCSPEYPSAMGQWLQEAVKSWQGELNGRLELTTHEASACPPFSDVNTHSFKYVEGWIEMPGESATIGQTVVTFSGSEFVDADIFMMMGEIQEALDISYGPGHKPTDANVLADSALSNQMKSSVTHEVGHLLGLHHVFDGTESIMSYSDTDHITAYDRAAVQGLYPLKTSSTFGRYFR